MGVTVFDRRMTTSRMALAARGFGAGVRPPITRIDAHFCEAVAG
jgi:hypothetical protein